MATVVEVETRKCPRCENVYPADAENFYQNPKTGTFGYCRGVETSQCNQALDREYREKRAAKAKAAIEAAMDEVLKSRRNKQTGTQVEALRRTVPVYGSSSPEPTGERKAVYTRCVDHGITIEQESRKAALAALGHPVDWCGGCRATL